MPAQRAHQLKPSRGSKGSATIPAMIVARCMAKCVRLHGAIGETTGNGQRQSVCMGRVRWSDARSTGRHGLYVRNFISVIWVCVYNYRSSEQCVSSSVGDGATSGPKDWRRRCASWPTCRGEEQAWASLLLRKPITTAPRRRDVYRANNAWAATCTVRHGSPPPLASPFFFLVFFS